MTDTSFLLAYKTDFPAHMCIILSNLLKSIRLLQVLANILTSPFLKNIRICSTMSVLTEKPNLEIFSSVPDLDDAIKDFDEKGVVELIQAVGEIFVKHNVYDDFGLSMIHRHFEMSEKEILVETIKEDKSISVTIPWNFEGVSAQPSDKSLWKSYGMNAKKFVVPQHWCFTTSGDLVPFEYLATDETLPVPSAEFSKELYSALQALGVETMVGLRRIVNLRGTKSWETTPHGMRANVLVFGEQPEELKNQQMVQVLWYFNSEGQLRKGNGFCIVHCSHCSHCNHCGTCH